MTIPTMSEQLAAAVERIAELELAIKSLPDDLNVEEYLKGLDRPTDFAISQAKSRAISGVFSKIKSAKKLLNQK
ncbi:MAG: hypothetical protein ACRCVX_02180 [Shewanella sp.]